MASDPFGPQYHQSAAPPLTPPSVSPAPSDLKPQSKPPSRSTLPAIHDKLLGKTLGKCRLLKRLGRGGMGDVYLAEHQTLQKKVAVKILPPDFTRNEELLGRFRREAIAAARLDHPNIVQVHDVGEQDGYHYLVMQYVDGKNLQETLDERKKLDPKEAARVAFEIAKGLQAAHEAGVVHRDVKPANILIATRGEVKLVDFGLAFDLDSKQSLTMTGTVMGTPQFLSPEQAQGLRADARSDVYSLGVCLYTMVTGQRPFVAESQMGVLFKHIHEKPRPPREIDPAIPEALCDIVLRMLEKKPEGRYPTAEELGRDLDSFLKDVPLARKPVAVPRRSSFAAIDRRPRSRAMPVAVGLAIAAALAFLAFLGAFAFRSESETPEPSVAPARPGFQPVAASEFLACRHLEAHVSRGGPSLRVNFGNSAEPDPEPHYLVTRRNDLADFQCALEILILAGRPEIAGRLATFGDPVEPSRGASTNLVLEGLPAGRWVPIVLKIENERLELVVDGVSRAARSLSAAVARTGRFGFRLQRGQRFEIRNVQLKVARSLDPTSLAGGLLTEEDRRLVRDRDYAPVLRKLKDAHAAEADPAAREAILRLGQRLTTAVKVVAAARGAASQPGEALVAQARKVKDLTPTDFSLFLWVDGELRASLDYALAGGDFRADFRPHLDDFLEDALRSHAAPALAERLWSVRDRLTPAQAGFVGSLRAAR